MTNDTKWLMASDIHFPLHDPRKVELFMKVMKWFKPDAVDYLGDIDDADSTGRWAVGPELMVGVGEGGVKLTTELFAQTRDILPNADIHMHDGNHGWTRHNDYLKKNAPAMLDILDSDVLYQYSKYGVQWHDYDKPPVLRFGDMYGHHGESVSKHAGESVRNDCLTWDISLVRGHSHRMGAWYRTYPMTGRMIRGYEIGHLCMESKMDYTRAPDWQAGFAIAHVVNDWPHMQLIQINDYTCVVDGKVFRN
jgi:predicted phosphodiesterase